VLHYVINTARLCKKISNLNSFYTDSYQHIKSFSSDTNLIKNQYRVRKGMCKSLNQNLHLGSDYQNPAGELTLNFRPPP
jgi:hypothetical protein